MNTVSIEEIYEIADAITADKQQWDLLIAAAIRADGGRTFESVRKREGRIPKVFEKNGNPSEYTVLMDEKPVFTVKIGNRNQETKKLNYKVTIHV